MAGRAMVATSQPTASLAGLDVLRLGGNAADAAIAAAAVLCVAEPMSTGVGGDAFAIVSDGTGLHGLDAAGPAPRAAAALPVPTAGAASPVVPGAVHGWEELSRRFGRLGLDTVLSRAIELARSGVPAGMHCAHLWREATRAPAEFGPAPRDGQPFVLPGLASTLERIAEQGARGFYEGPVAQAIAASTWLEEEDLASYGGARWVEPLSTVYRGLEVFELPPPTQGIAALEGLALLEGLEPTLPNRIRAAALALEDAFEHVVDGADVSHLLAPEHLATRREGSALVAPELRGGTVYLCCVDEDGMAVSFIQSIFEHFGSGVVAPGTGVVLNNRAACFEVGGQVVPGVRPYHTIIPGMLARDGQTVGPFGVMGGFIQAQAHVQLVSALVDDELDPQAALDQPRFRIEPGAVRLEPALWDRAGDVERMGLRPILDDSWSAFGAGQVILSRGDHLIGGSDSRRDGFAAGY